MLRVLLTIGSLQFLTMVVQLIRTKSLALLLGPESVGLMAVIDKLLAVFAQTASLSLPYAALRFLPAAWDRGPGEYRRLLRHMLRLLGVLAVAASAIGLAGSLVGGGWASELRPYRLTVFIAFASVPTLVLVPFLQSAVAGRLEHNASMVWMLAHAVVFTFTGVAGAWSFGLIGSYAAYAVLGSLLVGAMSWWLVHSSRRSGTHTAPAEPPGRAPGGREALGLPAEIWGFCIPLFGLAFLAPYAALFVHYSVLARLGAQAAGLMQAAMGVSLAVRTALGSAHSVFLTPNVSRTGTFDERLTWANNYQKTLCCVVVAATPPLLLFPTIPVDLLYSRAFEGGASAVHVFVISEMLLLFAGTYGALVVAFNHIAFHVIQNLVAQAVLMGVAALLIPRVGIAGAAWGGVAMAAVLFVATSSFLRLRYGVWPPGAVGPLLVFTAVVLIVCSVLGTVYPGLTWSTVVPKIVCYLMALAGLAAFLTPGDRENLIGLLSRAPARPADAAR